MASSSNLLSQTLPAPWGGIDVQTPDNQMATNKCRVLQNWLPGKPGRIYLRGPLRRPVTSDSAFPNGGATTWSGGWVYGDKLLMADMRSATVGYMVTDWSGASPNISTKVNPVNLNVGLYPFHTRSGNFVYGYTAGSAGTPFTINTPNRRTSTGVSVVTDSHLVSWNGGNLVGDFFRFGNATHPRGASDIKTFLNRLWVLNGSVPGTTTPIFSNRLYYSIDLGSAGGTLIDNVSDWQTGGVVNQVILEGSANDYGVALAFLNGRMVILRRQSTYILTGTSPATFQIRKVAGVGCVDPGSVMEWDDGIYFLSDAGYMFFDGATVRNVSTAITDYLFSTFGMGTEAVEMSVARFSSEHIVMTPVYIGTTTLTRRSFVYHVPSGAWSEFNAVPSVINSLNGVPQRVARVTNYPIVYDGEQNYDATYVTNPELASPAWLGGDQTLASRGGTKFSIPAAMWSRWLRLSSPGHTSHVVHAIFEHLLVSVPNPITVPALTVDLYKKGANATGNAFAGTAGVSLSTVGAYGLFGVSGGTSAYRTHPERQDTILRFDKDAVEVQLRAWFDGSSTTQFPQYAELFDTVVTFTSTSVREA